MKLNAKTQEELHAKLAATLLEQFHREPCDKCGFATVPPQVLTIVRQFLADNGTTADLRSQTPLRSLAGELPNFEDPERRVEKAGKKRTA